MNWIHFGSSKVTTSHKNFCEVHLLDLTLDLNAEMRAAMQAFPFVDATSEDVCEKQKQKTAWVCWALVSEGSVEEDEIDRDSCMGIGTRQLSDRATCSFDSIDLAGKQAPLL